jgi:uncharacterized protein with HEPN domain
MNDLQQLERRTRLSHIEKAATKIEAFTTGRTVADYEHDDMLAAAVERQFMIIGEALNRALEVDPSLMNAISEPDAIIGLRNQLVHNYPRISTERIWTIIEEDLPVLLREVRALLSETP